MLSTDKQTNKQTDRQTNQRYQKHNLLCQGGNYWAWYQDGGTKPLGSNQQLGRSRCLNRIRASFHFASFKKKSNILLAKANFVTKI